MSLTSREELLRPSGFAVSDETVDGWGTVRLRELTAGQLVFLTSINGADQQEAGRLYSKVIAMSLVDPNDDLLFDHRSEEDIELLQDSKPWSALERLANRIIEFNGFANDQVEARAKNSKAGRKK